MENISSRRLWTASLLDTLWWALWGGLWVIIDKQSNSLDKIFHCQLDVLKSHPRLQEACKEDVIRMLWIFNLSLLSVQFIWDADIKTFISFYRSWWLAIECWENVFMRMMLQQMITIAQQTLNDHWNDVCKAWINRPIDGSFVNREEMCRVLLRW